MTPYVQKIPASVRLSQPGQDPVDGFLMLAPRVGSDDRPETVVQLLNSGRSVLPFIRAADRAVLLIVQANVDWVALGPGLEPRLVFPPDRGVSHGQRVELSFTDGRRIEVTIQWDQAGGFSRLSDLLNWCDDFFATEASFGTLFVNKRCIREVRIIEARAERGGAHDRSEAAESRAATS